MLYFSFFYNYDKGSKEFDRPFFEEYGGFSIEKWDDQPTNIKLASLSKGKFELGLKRKESDIVIGREYTDQSIYLSPITHLVSLTKGKVELGLNRNESDIVLQIYRIWKHKNAVMTALASFIFSFDDASLICQIHAVLFLWVYDREALWSMILDN